MPLYPPTLSGMSTIVIHANSSGMCPSRNANLVILTSLSQCSLSRSFSLVASLSPVSKCSAVMTDGPLVRPVCSLLTATEISSPSGGLSAILTGCTSIRIGVGCPLGYQYHLWSLLHAAHVWSESTSVSISSPTFLVLYRLSSFSAAWNRIAALLILRQSATCVFLGSILWNTNLQVASEIHGATTPDLRVVLLTLFLGLLKCESPSCIGTPFGATMVQIDLSLQ